MKLEISSSRVFPKIGIELAEVFGLNDSGAFR